MLASFSARFAKPRRRPADPILAPGLAGRARFPAEQATADAATPPVSSVRLSIKREKKLRRLDLAIALAVSTAAHIGIALMPGETKKPAAHHDTTPVRELTAIELPVLDEPPVDAIENEAANAPMPEFAPPTQADYPSVVTVDSFIQPMQPPTPTGLNTDLDMLVVPPTATVAGGAAAPKLFELADLDRVPRRLRTGPLNYPPEFLRSKTEGTVVLLVVIDQTGRPMVERVLESTHPDFTRAAVQATEQSRYEAPLKGGAVVSARYTLRVPFRLNDG